jgi:hypothetical protein
LRGQEELRRLFASKAYARFCVDYPDIHFGGLSSDYGVRWDDWFLPSPVSSKKKQEMMELFKALGSNERAIVFHVDMIGEGIDVPGITGVMLFKNLCDVKLYQNIGRSCRLHGIDRGLLYSGEISVEDKAPWTKPQAWIIIPDLFAGAKDSIDKTRDLVTKLRTEYGFQSRTNVFIDVDRGLFNPDPINPVNPRQGGMNENSGLNEFVNAYEDIVDILHQDQVSRMKRKRTVCENLIARMVKDVEVPRELEEVYPNHFLANLLFVYQQARCDDFSWRGVPTGVQALFEANSLVGLTWPQVCDMIDASFPRYSAAEKELMNYMHLNYEAMREAIRDRNTEVIDMAKACLSSDAAKKKFGEVFTPITLVDEMLDKLPSEVWNDSSLRWIDPAMGSGNFLLRVYDRLMEGLAKWEPDEEARRKHILEQMIHGVELQPKNVVIARMFLDIDGKYNMHLATANSLEFDYWGGMKFDVVVGNPPYQDAEKAKGKLGSKALWVRFVNLALDNLLAKNGYLCFVHPSKWRKYQDELWDKMTSRQILHIDIHGYKDGQKVFGAATRYDWYVLQNCEYSNKTTIVDEEGVQHLVDIRDWSFIPNLAFDEVSKILAKSQPSVEYLHSHSIYEIRKPHMAKDSDDSHNLPCVYSVNRKNEPTFYFSTDDLGYFGIPKVIFASGATGFLVDTEGKYGLTQFATGIVDSPENLGAIAKVLDSKGFKRIIDATSMSKAEIDRKILGLFKKDFWKEFEGDA